MPPEYEKRVANLGGITQFATNKRLSLLVHSLQPGFTVANSGRMLCLPPECKKRVANLGGITQFATDKRLSLSEVVLVNGSFSRDYMELTIGNGKY